MRILIVSPYFPPQNAVASVRVHSFARALVEARHEVTVLTVAKRADQRELDLPAEGMEVVEIDYAVPRLLERLRSQWKQEPAQGSKQPSSGPSSVAGQTVGVLRRLRARRGVYSSVRMPDLTDYWVKPALDWCRRAPSSTRRSEPDRRVPGRPAPARRGGSLHDGGSSTPTPAGRGEQEHSWDLVISSSGPYTAHLVAMALKREGLAARWLADFRDLWVNNHVYPGLFPFTLRERALEKNVLRSADVVTTISEGAKAILMREIRTSTGGHSPPRKGAKGGHSPLGAGAVDVVYNGYDETAMHALPSRRIFPDDGLVRLVYTGALYPPRQDLTPLLRAFVSLADEHRDAFDRLRISAAGNSCDEWRHAGHRFGIEESIEVHGVVPWRDALRMQRDADALVLVDWPDQSEGVLTGKLFEYLRATVPILVIGGSPATPIAGMVERAGRGVHLGSDVAQIEQALIDLVENPATLHRPRDDEFIATLSRQRQAHRLVELAERLGTKTR